MFAVAAADDTLPAIEAGTLGAASARLQLRHDHSQSLPAANG